MDSNQSDTVCPSMCMDFMMGSLYFMMDCEEIELLVVRRNFMRLFWKDQCFFFFFFIAQFH